MYALFHEKLINSNLIGDESIYIEIQKKKNRFNIFLYNQ